METSRSDMLLRTSQEIQAFHAHMRQNTDDSLYLNKVCKMLTDIRPGTSFIIDNIVDQANTDKFLKCVCLYIDAWPSDKIKISSDYQSVIKE
jgi:hypothetical protein